MSAKLRVSAELIVMQVLADANVRIVGASYEKDYHVVVFDLEGPAIPAGCEEVTALISQRETTVKFVPRS